MRKFKNEIHKKWFLRGRIFGKDHRGRRRHGRRVVQRYLQCDQMGRLFANIGPFKPM